MAAIHLEAHAVDAVPAEGLCPNCWCRSLVTTAYVVVTADTLAVVARGSETTCVDGCPPA